ncbi:hypothetical protein [Hymenobacter cellulosilyticus]|uniref:Secretin/TonB short N-terminal domain-containing protein n=1 Tax=Hymenobacter cellulosilyticus TaxID=2932248 RepID=A0A8T9QA23_9BACT|nr:hypothetical protein [Hymenobacter cellulosilyticus]UOQ73832.1 hypothetical protein MUN79_07940 [Hymenobacter cellulosilyticus]
MRYLSALIFCLGLLASSVGAQQPATLLARRVSVAATDAPLQQVLRDIARQSGIPFSYSSTFIPLQKRVTLQTQGRQPVGRYCASCLRIGAFPIRLSVGKSCCGAPEKSRLSPCQYRVSPGQ